MGSARVALIVATDEYDDASLLRLTSPASDADALAKALGDPELGDFDVQILHNKDSREISIGLEELLSDRANDDAVLIHFSCHGIKDDAGELYLAARDTRPTRLGSTAVDAAFVNRLIRRSRAGQVVLFLDCCYGGAFERGVIPRASQTVDLATQFPQAELHAGRGRAIITASSAIEYAFEGNALAGSPDPTPSIFTSALTEGLLTGDADRDQDGKVGLDELYSYILERVQTANPKQTPHRWLYGGQGEMVIARNPKRRIEAAELPEHLHTLVTHPFAATRLGAVEELLSLAGGTNLGLAASARNLLVQLTSDDSRKVCDAATEAVAKATLRVSAETLDFGAVEVGARCTRDVELIGVPLVDASSIRTEGEAVTTRRRGRQLQVSLDTSRPGDVDARVLIEGPAGDAAVQVQAVVGAPATRGVKTRRGSHKAAPPSPITDDEPILENVPRGDPPPVPVQTGASDSLRQRRLGAVLMLDGVAGAVAAHFLPWIDDRSPVEFFGSIFDNSALVTWAWLLALVPVSVAALLLMASTRLPVAAGLALGGAAALLLDFLQNAPVGYQPPSDIGVTLSLISRCLVLVGAVVAVSSGFAAAPDAQRAGARNAARLLWVVLGAAALAIVVAWWDNESPAYMHLRLAWTIVVLCGLATLVVLLPLVGRQLTIALVALTTLSLLIAVDALVRVILVVTEPVPVSAPVGLFPIMPLMECAVALVIAGVVWAGRPTRTPELLEPSTAESAV